MKVSVIGTGNVGIQFAHIFNTHTISSRTLDGLPTDCDLYIISVSDSAVAEVASKMPQVEGFVVHTTGSVAMDVLKKIDCHGYGVLYPFQTISKKRPLEASAIPLLIEGNNRSTTELLKSIAMKHGFTHIEEADSDKRRKIHLTGTFACNFTNAMIAISQQILSDCGIDKNIINPLLGETIDKLKTLPASDAQTGPAARKDIATIKKHLQLLDDLGMKRESEIYTVVSDYIMNKKEKPLSGKYTK